MKKELLKFHQGDVIGNQILSIPSGAKPIAHKPLALGEVSGHQHVLTGDVQLFEFEGRIIAAVGGDGAMLQHVHESNFKPQNYTQVRELPMADHKPHFLPKGNYDFYIQNSYNPFSKLMEAVID